MGNLRSYWIRNELKTKCWINVKNIVVCDEINHNCYREFIKCRTQLFFVWEFSFFAILKLICCFPHYGKNLLNILFLDLSSFQVFDAIHILPWEITFCRFSALRLMYLKSSMLQHYNILLRVALHHISYSKLCSRTFLHDENISLAKHLTSFHFVYCGFVNLNNFSTEYASMRLQCHQSYTSSVSGVKFKTNGIELRLFWIGLIDIFFLCNHLQHPAAKISFLKLFRWDRSVSGDNYLYVFISAIFKEIQIKTTNYLKISWHLWT